MAIFIGTFEEFNKYVGDYCRYTASCCGDKRRKERNKICQYCGNKQDLQSAHKHGTNRKDIMLKILNENFKHGDDNYNVDMDKFENLFKTAHGNDVFWYLCPKCHKQYDKHEITDEQIGNK